MNLAPGFGETARLHGYAGADSKAWSIDLGPLPGYRRSLDLWHALCGKSELAWEVMTDLLRHTLATLAYRAGKAVRGAPPEFASFQASPTTRTPAQILAHMGDLADWALVLADGKYEWHDSAPLPWDEEAARFFRALQALDDRLASPEPLGYPAERIFQGPIADALTHTGQIAMLRRIAGVPVRGENYFKAEIEAGRVGVEQATPKREFD